MFVHNQSPLTNLIVAVFSSQLTVSVTDGWGEPSWGFFHILPKRCMKWKQRYIRSNEVLFDLPPHLACRWLKRFDILFSFHINYTVLAGLGRHASSAVSHTFLHLQLR
jgi:hypothetical protein